MKIQPRFSRILRRAGGIFVGLKIHMPCSIFDDEAGRREHYTMLSVSLGFLFWQLDLDFCYNCWNEPIYERVAE